MRDGVALTAYLVNESRHRRPDLAADPLAADWIPGPDRPAVRQLWDQYAATVYPHDDLVVSLRGRYVLDVLTTAAAKDPDMVLVVCGAGFSSYPWLVRFAAAVEVDLPEIVAAKRLRAGQLRAAGIVDDREVTHVAADLSDPDERERVIAEMRRIAEGRPVAFVAEGLIFYLDSQAAREVATLGRRIDPTALTIVTYWPTAAAGNPVLAAQRAWFREHAVPEDATYLSAADLGAILGEPLRDLSPEQLQQHYLDHVEVSEVDLVPEYVAVSNP